MFKNQRVNSNIGFNFFTMSVINYLLEPLPRCSSLVSCEFFSAFEIKLDEFMTKGENLNLL